MKRVYSSKSQFIFKSLLNLTRFNLSSKTQFEGSPAKLFFQSNKSSNNQATDNLVVFHGLFGSHTNFRTILRHKSINSLVNSYSVDLRNHGNSEHKSDMSLADMGEDIVNFIEEQSLTNVFLMGHSMGGRAIMSALQNYPNSLINKVKGVIICDISPGDLVKERSADVYEMWAMINNLLSINLKNKPKSKIGEEVKSFIKDPSVASFMMMNIVEDETNAGNYKWRMNLKSIRDWYKQNLSTEILGAKWEGPRLIICGSLSHFVNQSKISEFQQVFPNLNYENDVHFIRGAGHWLHADKPDEFIAKVSEFITQIQKTS